MPTPSNDLQTTTSFELVLPPDPELLRVVRLMASGLASYTDLGFDAVEAVRVAADELVSTLIQAGNGDDVAVRYAITEGSLVISADATLADADGFSLDPLTDRILDEVASSHSFTIDGGRISGRIGVDLPATH